MEEHGAWLGRANDGYTSETTSGDIEAGVAMSVENMPAAVDSNTSNVSVRELYEQIRAQTLRSSNRLTSAIAESSAFYRANPIALMEQSLQQLQKNYLDADSRLRTGKVRVAVLNGTLAKFDEQLSTTPQYLSLSTAVPEEAIGAALAAGKRQELGALSQVQFRREEINPVWQQLQTQRAVLRQEFETASGEVTKLSIEVPAMEKEVRDLQNQLYQGRQAEIMIKENLERWQNNNEQLFRNYVELSNDMTNTAQELALLDQEVNALQDSANKSRGRVEENQKKYDKAFADLQVYELRQRAIQRQADVLLQKAQEAQTAVTEDVSDISLGPPAIAPERHYFPQRSVFLLIATIVTGGILLGLMARQRYLTIPQA
jgi:chromosome segregation ATPase